MLSLESITSASRTRDVSVESTRVINSRSPEASAPETVIRLREALSAHAHVWDKWSVEKVLFRSLGSIGAMWMAAVNLVARAAFMRRMWRRTSEGCCGGRRAEGR